MTGSEKNEHLTLLIFAAKLLSNIPFVLQWGRQGG